MKSNAKTITSGDVIDSTVTALAQKITDRYMSICDEMGLAPADDRVGMEMTFYYAHAAEPRIDLHRLLASNIDDFAHDCAGMRQHIDTTAGPNFGKMRHCFVPRCARRLHSTSAPGPGR